MELSVTTEFSESISPDCCKWSPLGTTDHCPPHVGSGGCRHAGAGDHGGRDHQPASETVLLPTTSSLHPATLSNSTHRR
jgi:hypothetical protein